MRSVGIRLLTATLLVMLLVGGYSVTVSAAASDPGIHIIRHINSEQGTTEAAITVKGLPEDTTGLQFDLIINSDIKELSMTWNPKLAVEYANYQDKNISGNKIQRTYYIVAKSMPLESNNLYIGKAVYNNVDVTFETSGEMKLIGDNLQETNINKAALKIEDSDNNGGQDSNSPSGDNVKPPVTDEDQQEPGNSDGDSTEVSFSDIDGHWAASYIQYVASKGIMNGTGKGKFEPNIKMTRAMFVQTLFNAEKALYETNPTGIANSFKDVVPGSWYEEAVNWAVEQGITSGLGNQKFGPQQEITREQMAVMMYQYCKLKGMNLPETEQTEFKDQDQISVWAKEAVAAINKAGIMNGMNGNKFEPKTDAKRSEVAAVIERFAKILLSEEA